jgi:signal transduction histidine kinase
MSDRAAVSQILQQLLDNALKFSEEKSPVEIIASRQGELIQVSIRDYGIGIPAEHRPHIFKMFYQVDSDSSRRYGGAGIGLALVKMLADGLNVEIQVESTVGRGSTFSFYLPIADLN